MTDLEKKVVERLSVNNDLFQVRTSLLKEGFSKEEVDSAISAALKRKKQKVFFVFISVFILFSVVLLSVGFFLFHRPQPSPPPVHEPGTPKPVGTCKAIPDSEQEACLRKFLEDGNVCIQLDESLRYACYRVQDVLVLKKYNEKLRELNSSLNNSPPEKLNSSLQS